MPEATGDALSHLLDHLGEEQGVELWQVLQLSDGFGEAVKLRGWNSVLGRSLRRLQNLDSLADKEDLLAKGGRDVRSWKHPKTQCE